MKRAWLQPFTWAVILETNRQLCLPNGALHQPTSDGYEPARQLWESLHRTEMTLAQATDLCRRCQQLAPFCNFNGNTFAPVIRKVISTLADRPETKHVSGNELAGHHRPLAETPVAGKDAPPLDEHSGASGTEHGLRGRTGELPNPPRDSRPERATRFIETTRGVLKDFNGRVVRLFLSELLRRLDLPPVRLEAEGETERAAYFAALEAADHDNLAPLIEIWQHRLATPEPPTA